MGRAYPTPTTGRDRGRDLGLSSARRRARRSGRRCRPYGSGAGTTGTWIWRSSIGSCARSFGGTFSTLAYAATCARCERCSTTPGVAGDSGSIVAAAKRRFTGRSSRPCWSACRCPHPRSSTMSRCLRGSTAMRQSGVETLITEEPDDRIGPVRLCGGGWPVMAVSTRTLLDDGRIRYELKTPYRDGTTHVMLLRASCPSPCGPAFGCSKSLRAILSNRWIF